jgi:hypothetical protein
MRMRTLSMNLNYFTCIVPQANQAYIHYISNHCESSHFFHFLRANYGFLPVWSMPETVFVLL